MVYKYNIALFLIIISDWDSTSLLGSYLRKSAWSTGRFNIGFPENDVLSMHDTGTIHHAHYIQGIVPLLMKCVYMKNGQHGCTSR